MPEIDITDFVTRTLDDPWGFSAYSASVAERGETVGKVTWAAAKHEAKETPILPPEHEEAARRCFRDMGFDDEEVDAYTSEDLNALMIQLISGDYREYQDLGLDPESYQAASEAGQVSGSLFWTEDGRIFYYFE